METNNIDHSSPLSKYSRQPKLFISLPSNGQWYGKDILKSAEDIEVFSMTASDEIALKTPDGLITGQVVVDVIQSCIPAIKDPWLISMYDFDYILAAIRMATYGGDITVTGTCSKCGNQDAFAVNIQAILDHIDKAVYKTEIKINDFFLRIRPLYYKEATELNKITTAVQRAILQQIPNIQDDDKKQEQIESLYKMINTATLDAVTAGVTEVVTPEGDSEKNPQFIKDFIRNTDPSFYNSLQETYKENNKQIAIPEYDVECGECTHKYKISTQLDQANFFGKG